MESLADLIGPSPEMETLRGQVRRLLQLPTGHRAPPVLLLGETGTGKGLVARLLHRDGPRAGGPFIDVNCAAIPETLLEAELFGFERGAFTGASQAKSGLFQAAHGGTLFLDEVGLLLDGLQAKLLTAIESREVRRLGSTRREPADVWILAATSDELTAATHGRRFRPDLYYRLATVVLRLPPLRTRGRDVLELATHFLARAASDHGVGPKTLAEDASAALLAYGWPGNVRELANVLERVTLLEDRGVITASMLGLPVSAGAPPVKDPVRRTGVSLGDLRRQERELLIDALTHAQGNITRAAARLGIPRNTLRYRMEKHGLVLREVAAGETATSEPATETSPAVAAPAAPAPSVAAPAIRREHRLVTVLGARLEAAESTAPFRVASVITTLIAKVTGFGARLEDLTPTGFVAAFGLDATEDGPRRAVHAARAMIQELRPRVDQNLGEMTVRCGVHLGRYLVATGGAPDLDARARHEAWTTVNALLEQTEPNSVVLDRAAARFVERRFALEPVGHGAVTAYRVTVGSERPGFDVRGRTLTRLVGRARDLDTLHELLRRTESGEGQSVGLVGEPGVGKSRLVYEFRRSLAPGRVTCLEGRCLSYGSTTPYLPIIDLVRNHFGTDDSDPPAAVADKLEAGLQGLGLEPKEAIPYLLHLLGSRGSTEPLQSLTPAVVKTRTIDTLKHLVLAESRRRTLVVVIEDVHWIDPISEEALGALVESLGAAPLMLVTTYRPGYRPPWIGRSYAWQLVVPRLTRADSLTVVRSVSPDLAADLAEVIATHGEGVPFFLEELARVVADDVDHRGAVQVPDTIQGVLLARLDRLPVEDKELLETASVLGTDVSIGVLAAVTERSEETLADGLARLRAAEFLNEHSRFPDAEYTFKHALTHEVAYGSLLPDRRRALHARVVAAIEALYPERLAEHVERLAHHALRGAVWDKAVGYLRQAARKASAHSAYRQTVTCLEQALAANVHRREPERSSEAIDIRVDIRNAFVILGEYGRTLDLLGDAEVAARALGDERRLGRVCSCRGHDFFLSGAPNSALDYLRRALDIARRTGDAHLEAAVSAFLGQTYHVMGDYRRGLDVLEGALRTLSSATRHGPLQRVICLTWMVWSLVEVGDFVRARALGEEALGLAAAADHKYALALAHLGLGRASLQAGEVAASVDFLHRGYELCQRWDLPAEGAAAASLLGLAYARAGRTDDGRALMAQAVERATAMGVYAYMALRFVLWGEACLSAGEVDQAMEHAARGLELARRHGERGHEAGALRLLGDVCAMRAGSDAERAQEFYRRAASLGESLGMRPLVAHCHLGLGKLFTQLRDGEKGEGHLATAATMYREMGMVAWLAAAESGPLPRRSG
jgi:transcriptional regulator with AAA-type ATPase domain/tetratricopeptide (TPR) repeat protein